MRSRGGSQWAARYELERLTQLRSEAESVLNRFVTECVRESGEGDKDHEEQWMRTAGNVEEIRDWMLRDLDRWIKKWCETQSGQLGC